MDKNNDELFPSMYIVTIESKLYDHQKDSKIVDFRAPSFVKLH